jgi:hypothetical protein
VKCVIWVTSVKNEYIVESLPMEAENRIFARYYTELAAIATLDRCYYLKSCPTSDERRDYALRQAKLEEMRTRFYSELASAYESSRTFRCRFLARRSRP